MITFESDVTPSMIIRGDNLSALAAFMESSFELIYIDPPFNTGTTRRQKRLQVTQDETGDRTGFGGHRYNSEVISDYQYTDTFDGFLEFLEPRLEQAHRVLTDNGSFFLHLDYREVHYVKVMLDDIFGRDSFMNEIIWAYDYGARSKKRWPTKHDTILWYAKDPQNYTFNYDVMDRIPYMAPGLVGKEKAAKGKTPTDVWWHTIVPTNGKERTGYPTQKPAGILERIIKVHSNQGDRCLDCFSGSGTLGEVAARNDRSYVLIDNNNDAVQIQVERLSFDNPTLLEICENGEWGLLGSDKEPTDD